jgi:hypothetical protein
MPAIAIADAWIEAEIRPQRAVRLGSSPVRLTEHHESLSERSPRPRLRFDHFTHQLSPN